MQGPKRACPRAVIHHRASISHCALCPELCSSGIPPIRAIGDLRAGAGKISGILGRRALTRCFRYDGRVVTHLCLKPNRSPALISELIG
jgi:hypothetical protein